MAVISSSQKNEPSQGEFDMYVERAFHALLCEYTHNTAQLNHCISHGLIVFLHAEKKLSHTVVMCLSLSVDRNSTTFSEEVDPHHLVLFDHNFPLLYKD